ncbi:MAG: ABC transporter permease [Pseudomonadales bacterium]
MAIDAQSTVTIRHTKGWASLGLGELWAYREMIFFLAMRTVKVRYKQTVFGIAWVLIQPLTSMIIFTFIFGRLAKIPSDGIPYPVFVFAGLVPWQFFSGAVSRGADSLVGSGSMFKQVLSTPEH